MHRPRRPGPLGVSAAVGLTALGTGAWLGWTGLQARDALESARTSLQSARDALVDRDVTAARAAIAAAAADTGRARGATDGLLWRLAASVPGEADNSLVVVRGLTQAADELASQVLPQALAGAEAADPSRLRRPDGSIDLDVVRAAAPPVTASAAQAQGLRADVEALPSEALPAAVADARAELLAQVEELAQALGSGAGALEIAPTLLGADGPRRYLVLVQQTAESRGTGGLFGGYVELVADGGRLSAVGQGSNSDLRNGLVPPGPDVPVDFVERYEGFLSFRIWQNVNLSPDLPVVAKVVEERWRAQGGQPLDGVVLLDAKALARILEGDQDVVLPDGRRVPPDQLEQYLAVGQYEGVPLTATGALQRKDQLSDVAAVVAARLTSGSGDTQRLLTGLVEAVRSGHVQLAVDDPVLAPRLAEFGVDGGLPRGEAPVAYPVVYNDSEGKLDHFLDRSVRYEASSCDGDFRNSTITVTLTNTAPPAETLPPYLTIFAGGPRTEVSSATRVALNVYGTRSAGLLRARVDGVVAQPENPEGALVTVDEEAGLPVWSTVLTLQPGQPRTVQMEVVEPTAPGAARVPEQPLARPLAVDVDVPVCRG